MTQSNRYVLNGLDSYSREELQSFWASFDPKGDAPRILGVGLSCSNRCNLKCIYCYAGTLKPLPNELTCDEQMSVVSQAKALGARMAIMCGDAEPLMDPSLLPIVAHCCANGMVCVVVSNGTVLGDDHLARSVHGMDGGAVTRSLYEHGAALLLKMDSADAATYEQIVGVKRAHARFQTAVDRVVAAGFNRGERRGDVTVTRLAFSGVVMKDTLDQVPQMRAFADGVQAQFICKLPSLVGNALDNLPMMFPVEQYEEIRAVLAKHTAKRETLMVDTPRCMAWHYGPVVGITGDIRECYTSDCKGANWIGNVRQTPLRELIVKRNRVYDIATGDFCPVKARINKEFVALGKDKVWKVLPQNECEAGF
jgi:MoaA/NifB/PqqE/SkfB family radical SAM enzyme